MSASTNDAAKAIITTTGILRTNFPIIPVIMSRGRNALTVVRIVVVTGIATSFAPRIAASRGGTQPVMYYFFYFFSVYSEIKHICILNMTPIVKNL